jgi:hypothetical protein
MAPPGFGAGVVADGLAEPILALAVAGRDLCFLKIETLTT